MMGDLNERLDSTKANHGEVYHGCHRESSKSILEGRIIYLKDKITGYEGLLKIVSHLELNSPVESALWGMLVRERVD